MVTFKLIC